MDVHAINIVTWSKDDNIDGNSLDIRLKWMVVSIAVCMEKLGRY